MDTDVMLQKHYFYEPPNVNTPLLEALNFTNKHTSTGVTKMNAIICVLKGKGEISSDIYPHTVLNENEVLFLPAECRFKFEINAYSRVFIIRFDPFQNLYGSYSIEELYVEYQRFEFTKEAGRIKLNDALYRYLTDLTTYLKNELFNDMFYEIKIKELLFILYGYYSKQQLCDFFKPILNNDFVFASFVLSNWFKVKSAKQLAELSAYCETGFNKKFKKVFGVTPYKWLNEKRATKILYDIINSDKSFKLIAEEYNFNSQQQFNDYCIRNFKKTSGSIRKK